tara:strand:+ start:567 stop:1070 length:504 start_codon:yes stop_codon:yes gene_type:complete
MAALSTESLDILLNSLTEKQRSTRHPKSHVSLEEVLKGFLQADTIQALEASWGIPCTNGTTSKFITNTTGWKTEKDGVPWPKKLERIAKNIQNGPKPANSTDEFTKKLYQVDKAIKEKYTFTDMTLTVSLADLERFGIIHPDRVDRFNILKELLTGAHNDKNKFSTS